MKVIPCMRKNKSRVSDFLYKHGKHSKYAKKKTSEKASFYLYSRNCFFYIIKSRRDATQRGGGGGGGGGGVMGRE